MPRKYFTLTLSAEEFHSYYRGAYRFIIAQTEDGMRLQFPAGELRPFVNHTGVRGRFEITFSSNNKLLELRKIE